MAKIKISPISMEKAKAAKEVSKNISDVVDFQVSMGAELNRVLKELNDMFKLFADIPNSIDLKNRVSSLEHDVKSIEVKYDDSGIKNQIAELKDAVENIDCSYDDSALVARIETVRRLIPRERNNSKLKKDIEQLAEQILKVSGEFDAIKKTLSLNQAEMKSHRNSTGSQIDELRQQLNRLTEVK